MTPVKNESEKIQKLVRKAICDVQTFSALLLCYCTQL